MTIVEAMQRGLTAVRKHHWTNNDRLELERILGSDGHSRYGAWGRLVTSTNRQRNIEILLVGDEDEDWIEHLAQHE